MSAFLAFVSVLLLDMFLVTWCALWPLRKCIPWHHDGAMVEWLWRHRGAWRNTNLDVWMVSVLKWIVLLTTLAVAAARSCRHVRASAVVQQARTCRVVISAACSVSGVVYIAKALASAVVADDWLWPACDGPRTGLVWLYGSIVAAAVASGVERACGRAMLTQWSKAAEAQLTGAAEPLLSTRVSDADDDEEGPRKTIWSLVSMSRPDTPILLVAFSAGTAAALAGAAIPNYTGKIIDYARERDVSAFEECVVKLLLVSLCCAVLTGIRGGLFTLTMARLNTRIRTNLFGSLVSQELGFYDVNKTGDLLSRLSADTTTVADQISLQLNVLVRSATQAAMVLAFMALTSWRLTVIAFVSVPLIVVLCKVYGEYYRQLSKQVQTELAQANTVAEEVVSSVATVKAHAAQQSSVAAYAAKLLDFYKLTKKQSLAYACYMTVNTFLPSAVSAAVLLYGGYMVLNNDKHAVLPRHEFAAQHMQQRMTAGALVSFVLYQQNLLSAFQLMGDVFSALTAAVGAADKVIELIHRKPKIGAGGRRAVGVLKGEVELQRVVFRYPARPGTAVLDGICMRVQAGETVALVGPSGGGKSSIVKLIERFYEPVSGRVLLDGADIASYDDKWLRRHVAFVGQEPVLFARSIRRNILYGLEAEDGCTDTPSQDEVEAAAAAANAHDFITQLPDGYDTECGERGMQLSGGQKQRIAIARALVRKPTVLLLDEATSALDTDSEALVQEALERSMHGRTVLLIAHRMSSVVMADRVVVIAAGQVVETGPHDELMQRNGMYASFVNRQFVRGMTSSSASLTSLDAAFNNGGSSS